MNRKCIVSLLLHLCLFGSLRAEESIRIVTWNIQWFPGRKMSSSPEEQVAHMAAAREAIQKIRPDILLLQEIRDQPSAEKLVEGLPGFKVHVTSRFRDRFGNGIGFQQVVIASRFEAWSAWSAPWQKSWADAPRGFAFAALDVGWEKPLLAYTVHLKSNLGEAIENVNKREDSAEQLSKHIAEMRETYKSPYTVLGGDFNTDWDGVVLKGENTLPYLVQHGLFWAFNGIPLTARITSPGNGKYPPACFDHIFSSGLGQPIGEVIAINDVSDHLPVKIEILNLVTTK